MGRRKKQPEYPEIEIPNEKIITIAFNTPELVIDDKGFKELCLLIPDYHEGLDKRLEQDKQKRKNTMKLFQEIEKELTEYQDSMPDLSNDIPKKNYCKNNIGGKWVDLKLKPMGKHSYIIQKREEDENND